MRIRVIAALTPLFLASCGGGSGGGSPPAANAPPTFTSPQTASVTENGTAAPTERETEQQEKASYDIPKLNIYRDMGDLLALDPPVPGLGDTPWKEPEESSK